MAIVSQRALAIGILRRHPNSFVLPLISLQPANGDAATECSPSRRLRAFRPLRMGLAVLNGKAESSEVFALLGGPELTALPDSPQVIGALSHTIHSLTEHDPNDALNSLNPCRRAEPLPALARS